MTPARQDPAGQGPARQDPAGDVPVRGALRRRRGRVARRLGDLRTALAGVDPGLARLRLASVAVASMLLASGLTEALRRLVVPSEPVTVLLFGGVLAMISNLAVNEAGLGRQRTTTLLFALPAAATTVAGTLLAPHRVVADVVFVAVMVGAVYVRRFGPRGFALGMGAFMPFFFTQFLRATPGQLPGLLAAVVLGVGSTLLLRGFVFAERPERTLRRLVGAFRARAHVLVTAVDDVLAGLGAPASEAGLERLARARRRLNEVALLVEDQLEQTTAGRVWPGLDNEVLALRVFDAELALERLAVSVRRVTTDDEPPPAATVAALRTGIGYLRAALTPRARHEAILVATADARGAVAGLVADVRPGHARVQRAAFAVRRLADAVAHAQRDAPARPVPTGPPDGLPGDRLARDVIARPPAVAAPDDTDRTDRTDRTDEAGTDRTDEGTGGGERPGILLTTRQAVQVGVSTGLAIVVGELVSPNRWYWAVIAAFVVFANTQSRGDLLSRGWGRIVGTVGGVAAGMVLAVLVGGRPDPVAGPGVRVRVPRALPRPRLAGPARVLDHRGARPGLRADRGVQRGGPGAPDRGDRRRRPGQRAGGVPRPAAGHAGRVRRGGGGGRRRLRRGAARGRRPARRTRARAAARRARPRPRRRDRAAAPARPAPRAALVHRGPAPRALRLTSGGLRVLVGCDHYARSLARLADGATDPSWAPTLDPAVDRVRANLDGLRDVLVRGHRRSDGDTVRVRSAEELVDAAEAHAARVHDPHRRADLLTAARLLRRVDQAVVGLAVDLGAADDPAQEPGQDPSSSSSAALTKTRSGS